MAGRPLRPATRHRHGAPLPHRLADRPQGPPSATVRPFLPQPTTRGAYAGLAPVSQGCPPRQGRFPTCSAPVRHGRPLPRLPSDLHALGTPPALSLSQDQTLHHLNQNCMDYPCRTFASFIRLRQRLGIRQGTRLRLSCQGAGSSQLHAPASQTHRIVYPPRRHTSRATALNAHSFAHGGAHDVHDDVPPRRTQTAPQLSLLPLPKKHGH